MSLPDPDHACLDPGGAPRVLTARHTAYLKVAEGCSKSCTYCIIRKLRGRHRSRPPEDILAEARELAGGGVTRAGARRPGHDRLRRGPRSAGQPRQPDPPAGLHPRQRPEQASRPGSACSTGTRRASTRASSARSRSIRTHAPTSTSRSSTRAAAC
ncbi:MAG: radical SAM protein [Desulfobacterales bacterium]|nr:radical SAM protein [Desulfobacterales bacterium]